MPRGWMGQLRATNEINENNENKKKTSGGVLTVGEGVRQGIRLRMPTLECFFSEKRHNS